MRAEIHAPAGRTGEWLAGLECFDEIPVEPAPDRSRTLALLSDAVFRDDSPLIEADAALTVRGAPQGEGLALEVARAVRDRLAAGVPPDDIVVAVPLWDDQAQLIAHRLADWSIPAWTDVERPVLSDPAVAVLLQALHLPVAGWPTDGLARILRHALLNPPWATLSDRVLAARTLDVSGVAQNADAILASLQALAVLPAPSALSEWKAARRRSQAARAAHALEIVTQLIDLLESGPGDDRSLAEHAAFAARLADELGLRSSGWPVPFAIEHLLSALDDALDVLDHPARPVRGPASRTSRSAFLGRLESLARDHRIDAIPPRTPAVRVTTTDRLGPQPVPHLIVANLAEGTMPSLDSLSATPAPVDPISGQVPLDPAYAREMNRFLQVIGAAWDTLTLLYPTADPKGQPLLHSAFLDDLRSCISPSSWAARSTEDRRLAPVPEPSLCGAPRDAQARAILQSVRRDQSSLQALLADPRSRASLDGIAQALRLHQARADRERFGPFEGVLPDSPQLRARLRQRFLDADRFTLTPSQIESFAFCPFQFYMRHVLATEVVDPPEEFGETPRERGNRLHRALQDLHLQLRAHYLEHRDDSALLDLARERIEAIIRDAVAQEPPPIGPVEASRRRIVQERNIRVGRRYLMHLASYAQDSQPDGTEPSWELELGFGRVGFGADEAYPPISFEGGTEPIDIQGRLDRVDLYERPDGVILFRVIDYKSGSHCPTPSDVRSGVRVQLPLYAMAVERGLLAGRESVPLDMGYWALHGDGYRSAWPRVPRRQQGPITPMSPEQWGRDRSAFESYVLALVDTIRSAEFPVAPHHIETCETFCEFRSACRVRAIRRSGKSWPDRPVPDLEANP
jgi:hypothetical protein